jgi:hypothetical protein
MIASFAIVVGCVYIALAFSPEAVQIAALTVPQENSERTTTTLKSILKPSPGLGS